MIEISPKQVVKLKGCVFMTQLAESEVDARTLPLTMPLWPDAAKVLGIGRSTAYELVKRDEFPIRILKLGGKFRISRADLLNYLGESA